jgi:hypothetical protein
MKLVAAIARGRRWLGELITDLATDAEAIAKHERCSLRHVNMTLSLAFISPAPPSLPLKVGCHVASVSNNSASSRLNGIVSSNARSRSDLTSVTVLLVGEAFLASPQISRRRADHRRPNSS